MPRHTRHGFKVSSLNWFQILLFVAVALEVVYIMDPTDMTALKGFVVVILTGLLGLILQIFLQKREIGGCLITLLVGVAVIVMGYVAYNRYQQTVDGCLQLITEPLNASASTVNGDLLVIVSGFSVIGDGTPLVRDPGGEILEMLRREEDAINRRSPLYHIRVEYLTNFLIKDAEQARAVSNCQKATIVIWGSVRNIDVRYEYIFTNRFGHFDEDRYSTILTESDKPEEFTIQGGGGGRFMLDLALARLYYQSRDYESSFNYLEDAVAYAYSYPQIPRAAHADALIARGMLESKIFGKNPEALADFNEAIGLDPESGSAYTSRGAFYDALGRTDEALADFNKAIELSPDKALSYYNRGTVYLELGENPEALADFNKVIELNHSDAYAYNNRGVLYDKLGRMDEALADFNKVIEFDPNVAQAYLNRSLIERKRGNIEQADADLAKYKELSNK